MRIRLSDADRERYQCPEWIEATLDRLSAREAATLQRETGLTPSELFAALRPRVEVRGEAGAWVELKDAESVPDGARLVTNYDAWAGMIWIALRRSGCKVTFDEAAGFDVFGFTPRTSEVADPGKDEADQSTPTTTSGD